MFRSETLKDTQLLERVSCEIFTCGLTRAPRFDFKTGKFTVVSRNRLRHLVNRFAFTLTAKAPEQDDLDWVRQQLSDREFELWVQMSSADRLHSILVAKRVLKELPGDETVLAAGLLHDVGKVAVRSGVATRIAAYVAKPIISAELLNRLALRRSFFSNLKSFLNYPRLGADLLVGAGSDEFVVRWAAEHHLRKDKWTVDERRGEVLVRADNSAV